MAKVLILPLLMMSSGHHQVADVIAKDLKEYGHIVKKIDLLSNSWRFLERSCTKVYQHVLKIFPQGYEVLYRRIAGPEYSSKINMTHSLVQIFTHSMKVLIKQENPDFIICTHGFPSAILDRLKLIGKCSVPVANVYTDFFINNFWGIKNIEYHFVSSAVMEKNIINNTKKTHGVFVSGIPIAKEYRAPLKINKRTDETNILITGGSSGLGEIDKLLEQFSHVACVNYYVLCGNNTVLYHQLKKMNKDYIIPFPYIYSKKTMCQLYDQVDLIIGKPGGVTVTECLYRRCLYLVHQCLPGQELYNLAFLLDKGLVIDGRNLKSFKTITNALRQSHTVQAHISSYLNSLNPNISLIINEILSEGLERRKVGGAT